VSPCRCDESNVRHGRDCRCACPREEPMEGLPSSIKYRHGDRCHKRAYRARVKEAAAEVGLQTAPTLAAAEAARTTNAPAGQTESPRKSSKPRRVELRVSYRKAVEAFTPHMAHADLALARAAAEGVLFEILTPKQRDALKETTS
jgi:hypothetical protein